MNPTTQERSFRLVMHAKQTNPLVTLIIPFYQAERFLSSCLTSATRQTYTNLDILLVDDRSTDRSMEIVREFMSRDDRIRVLVNRGGDISSARNEGVAGARGEYIAWMDSDDVMPENAIETLVNAAVAHDADMAMGAYVECHANAPIPFNRPVGAHPALLRSTDEVQKYFLTYGRYLNHLWTKLIRRSCWEGVSFPIGRIYEDMAVAPLILEQVRSCVVVPKSVYRYQVRPSSLSTSINLRRQMDGLVARLDYVAFMREHHPGLVPLAQDSVIAFGLNMLGKIEHVGVQQAQAEWDDTLAVMKAALPEAALQNILYHIVKYLLLHHPRLLAKIVHVGLTADQML